MTPRIGLILLTALLMQCGNPVETPLPGAETIPARLQETTHFNGGNAMFHAARMTEMGVRHSRLPPATGLPEEGTGQTRLDLPGAVL